MKALLLVVGMVLAAATMVFLYMGVEVLSSTPDGEPVGSQRTTGMFGACALAAFCGIGAFFCGYRYRHGEWP